MSVAPRAAGRLQDVSVRLGDRVTRGQRIAKIEDFEIVEQVKQAEAAQEVVAATIRQREADLQLAKTNVERSRNLFERQLLPKQTLDDNEARYQAAQAQLDLARAQAQQSKARLDELRINLGNTIITSPVNGFVSKRLVDPGRFVSARTLRSSTWWTSRACAWSPTSSRKISSSSSPATPPAWRSTRFPARRSRAASRASRRCSIRRRARRRSKSRFRNPDFRLKPGMYARVGITTDTKKDALVVPVKRASSISAAGAASSAAQRGGGLPRRAGRHRAGRGRRDARRPRWKAMKSSRPAPARCATAIASRCRRRAADAAAAGAAVERRCADRVRCSVRAATRCAASGASARRRRPRPAATRAARQGGTRHRRGR